MTFAAAIVTYNPDILRLKENIVNILDQFSCILIVDNFSHNRFEIKKLCESYSKVQFYQMSNNLGLSVALNEACTALMKQNFDWVMTLDQDSIIPADTLSKYKRVINVEENIGIISPIVIDRRRKYMNLKLQDNYCETEMAINSGSLINLEVWKAIGCYDENLFIDLIDNDFCKRVTLYGYKIIRCNNIVLDQEFGVITKRSPFVESFFLQLGKLLHSTNIQKLSYKKHFSPLRIYDTNKNILYLNKKFANYGGIGYENYNCKSYFSFFIVFSISSLIRGRQKIKILKSIISGVTEGREIARRTIPIAISTVTSLDKTK